MKIRQLLTIILNFNHFGANAVSELEVKCISIYDSMIST